MKAIQSNLALCKKVTAPKLNIWWCHSWQQQLVSESITWLWLNVAAELRSSFCCRTQVHLSLMSQSDGRIFSFRILKLRTEYVAPSGASNSVKTWSKPGASFSQYFNFSQTHGTCFCLQVLQQEFNLSHLTFSVALSTSESKIAESLRPCLSVTVVKLKPHGQCMSRTKYICPSLANSFREQQP